MKMILSSLVKLLITVSVLLSRASAQCDKPVIISEAATVCPGGQTTLYTNPIPGATYQWSDGGPATASRPAGPGKYAVTVTHGTCFETSDTVIITETPRPILFPDKFPSLCPGEVLTLTADTGNYWTPKSNFPGMARAGSVAVSIGSKGYFGTGFWSNGNFSTDWWEYDDATGVWTQKADFPGNGRVDATAFTLNNKAYVGTGHSGNQAYDDFYEYDPFLNTWTAKAPFPGGPVYGVVSFATGGRGYMGLGYAPNSLSAPVKFWSYEPATDAWTPIADFPAAGRITSSGFSLAGKGYISCGIEFFTNTFLNECWEYDPVANSWNAQAPLPALPRTATSVFTIGDHAYLIGGTVLAGATNVGVAEVWEFYNGVWTRKADYGGGGIGDPAAFGFYNKGIVLTGFPFNQEVWEYHPNTRIEWPDGSTGPTWSLNTPGSYSATFHNAEGCAIPSSPLVVTTPVVPTTVTRSGNDTICAGDSVVLSAGGDTWTQKNDYSNPIRYGTAFTLGGIAYFAGSGDAFYGHQFYRYNAAADTWQKLPDLPMEIASTVAVAWQGKAWLYGSDDKAIWMYDPLTGVWKQKAVCPGPAKRIVQGFLLGDQIIIAGGLTSSTGIDVIEVWAYDLNTDSWTRKSDLPYFVGYGSAFAINGKGYLCAGNSSYGAATGTPQSAIFLEYDPANDTWTQLPDFPGGARGAPVAFTDGHKAYVGMGNYAGINLTDLWQFDPVSKTWSRMADIPVGRYGTTAFVLGNYAYICTGGLVGTASRLSDVWQYELPYNYQWSNGQTTRSIAVKQSGDYEVMVSTYTGCVANTNPIHIEVLPATTITQAPASTAVCSDASVQYAVSASGVDISYQWQFNGNDINEGGVYSGTQTNNLTVSDVSIPGPGLFRCVVTGTCGTDTAETALTFLPSPAKPVITPAGSLALCDGESVTLTSSSASGNTWSNGSSGAAITVGAQGKYSVYVTDNNGCVSPHSDTVTVIVNPLPSKPVIAAGGPVIFCEGENVTLTSSASSGNIWSTGATSNNIIATATGSYTVQVTDANGCVSPASDAVTVTVNALPPKPVITPGGPISFCQGGSVTLTSSAATGNTWSNGKSAQSIVVPDAGTFSVQVTDANGCVSQVSDAITVSVHPVPAKPSITPSGPLEFCEGGSVTLTTASPATAYEWSTGSGAVAITVDQSGVYSVQIIENGCASPASDPVQVEAYPKPSGTITINGPLADGGIRYMELVAPQLPGAQYKWLTGDEEPVIRVTQSGHYRVTVISGAGCYSNFGITVQVIDLKKIPNTFTPNRDGVNDYWTIKEINLYPDATVAVFNRNGMKVYEAKGGSIKWDGTSNGHVLPAGVYYYVLDLKDGGPPVNGWINLMK